MIPVLGCLLILMVVYIICRCRFSFPSSFLYFLLWLCRRLMADVGFCSRSLSVILSWLLYLNGLSFSFSQQAGLDIILSDDLLVIYQGYGAYSSPSYSCVMVLWMLSCTRPGFSIFSLGQRPWSDYLPYNKVFPCVLVIFLLCQHSFYFANLAQAVMARARFHH